MGVSKRPDPKMVEWRPVIELWTVLRSKKHSRIKSLPMSCRYSVCPYIFLRLGYSPMWLNEGVNS
jgi:hypothetical protein